MRTSSDVPHREEQFDKNESNDDDHDDYSDYDKEKAPVAHTTQETHVFNSS